MRKLLIAAALVPACILMTAAAPAPAPQDLLDTVAAKAVEIYADKGFSPTGWVSNGQMGAGESKKISVTLKGGENYSIVGMCDGDCGDMNIVMTNAGGKVDEDVADDDFPIVGATESGTYTLNVSMVACKKSKCSYRLLAFAK